MLKKLRNTFSKEEGTAISPVLFVDDSGVSLAVGQAILKTLPPGMSLYHGFSYFFDPETMIPGMIEHLEGTSKAFPGCSGPGVVFLGETPNLIGKEIEFVGKLSQFLPKASILIVSENGYRFLDDAFGESYPESIFRIESSPEEAFGYEEGRYSDYIKTFSARNKLQEFLKSLGS